MASHTRGVATLLATLLIVTLLPGSVSAQEAPPGPAAAADWIAAELDSDEPSFDQFGVAPARADVVFALASLGARPGSVRQAMADLAATAASYVGDAASPNVGPLAKVLLAIEVTRRDPAGLLEGRDLEEELRSAQRPDGSFADDTFSHALAMLALGATDQGVPDGAADVLLDRQNPDGSWPDDFVADEPNIDNTALALQALIAAGASEGVQEAVGYLTDTQNAEGSWPNPFGEPNTNTAGLAGQALRAAGATSAADQAAAFVLSLQTADGGFAFDATQSETNGFATLQAVLALGGPAYFELEAPHFVDVGSDHLFAGEIDWLGNTDIARGCDPPANDSFCPDDLVTRGQMAAFIVRAFDPTETGGTEFIDDDDSVFEGDIQRLATAGITRGCNPPTNDRFCPDDPITRGEMAAFLVRALDLTETDGTEFIDDDDSVFEGDIQRLATAGITRGCNPPTNDRFCPDDPITRGEMAAFLFRALEG